jgi:hypothetical protein
MLEILYIDSSGDPGMYNHKNSEHYIVGGVALSEVDWRVITLNFNQTILKYFPKGNLLEIHTKDLFAGKPPYNDIDYKALVKDLVVFLKAAHVTLFGIVVHKDKFLLAGLGKPTDVVVRSLEEVVQRFHLFLQNRKQIGIIVSDASAEGFDTGIRTTYEYFRRQGTHFVTLTRIVDTIFFTPSQTAMGIQLADFVAYAIKRHVVDKDDSLFKPLESKFGEHNFRIIPDPKKKF